MTARARTAVLLLSLVLICDPAAAATMTLTLDDVQIDTCDSPWEEEVCTLQVVDTAEGDQSPPGMCVWDQQPEGVQLLGARLEIDATSLGGVEEVEVDLQENSGSGHTKITLYDPLGNIIQFVSSSYTGSPTDQSMPIFIPGSELGKIVISGSDALIQEVRLVGELRVGNDGNSWSALKTLW